MREALVCGIAAGIMLIAIVTSLRKDKQVVVEPKRVEVSVESPELYYGQFVHLHSGFYRGHVCQVEKVSEFHTQPGKVYYANVICKFEKRGEVISYSYTSFRSLVVIHASDCYTNGQMERFVASDDPESCRVFCGNSNTHFHQWNRHR